MPSDHGDHTSGALGATTCWVRGPVPRILSDGVLRGPLVEIAPDRALLRIPGVGRFLICTGAATTVEVSDGATTADVECFLASTGAALAALLAGWYPLRGSAIAIGGRAAIVLGAASIGKSSLVAAIAKRGHQLLADGIILVDRSPRVVPTSHEVQLWPDAAAAMALAPEAGRVIRPVLTKRAWPVGVPAGPDPVPLGVVVHVVEDGRLDAASVFVEDLIGVARLRYLAGAEWYPHAAEALGRSVDHLDHLAVVSSVETVFLSQGVGSLTEILPASVDAIESIVL